MKREEAIKILSSYDVNGVWADVDGKPYNAEEQAEAFDMVIEALSARPIRQIDTLIIADALRYLAQDEERHEMDRAAATLLREQILKYGASLSASVKEVKINLNEFVKVKLTDLGKEIYYHQFDDINEIVGKELCKPLFPETDEDGYTSFQLWEFIQLYGSYMGMGFPNVIEPLEIVYQI